MKKTIALIGLFLSLMFIFYIESSYFGIDSNNENQYPYIPVISDPEFAEEVDTNMEEIVPSLEYFFEEQFEQDGYIVETYREYEVYKNDIGQIEKKVPTSNYDYIKYYK